MLFRTILFNFIVFINCGLHIPGNVSKMKFSAYQTYQYDCKNKKKTWLVLGNRTYIYTQFDA